MFASTRDAASVEVLGLYPAASTRGKPCPQGNRGGFSGARLWRCSGVAGAFCLRAWPGTGPTPERLRWIHGLMKSARAAGLTFVPELLTTPAGATFVAHAGQLWELSTWMPGCADFHTHPTTVRL